MDSGSSSLRYVKVMLQKSWSLKFAFMSCLSLSVRCLMFALSILSGVGSSLLRLFPSGTPPVLIE